MNSDILSYPSFQSPQAQTNVSAVTNTISKVFNFSCSIEKIIYTSVIHRVNYGY